jgi:hypothetical protein
MVRQLRGRIRTSPESIPVEELAFKRSLNKIYCELLKYKFQKNGRLFCHSFIRVCNLYVGLGTITR